MTSSSQYTDQQVTTQQETVGGWRGRAVSVCAEFPVTRVGRFGFGAQDGRGGQVENRHNDGGGADLNVLEPRSLNVAARETAASGSRSKGQLLLKMVKDLRQHEEQQ